MFMNSQTLWDNVISTVTPPTAKLQTNALDKLNWYVINYMIWYIQNWRVPLEVSEAVKVFNRQTKTVSKIELVSKRYMWNNYRWIWKTVFDLVCEQLKCIEFLKFLILNEITIPGKRIWSLKWWTIEYERYGIIGLARRNPLQGSAKTLIGLLKILKSANQYYHNWKKYTSNLNFTKPMFYTFYDLVPDSFSNF